MSAHAAAGRGTEIRDGFVHCRFRAMAGPCEIIVETDDPALAEELAGAGETEAKRIEARFSRYRPDSIVSRINGSKGETVEVDRETATLLTFADQCYRLSGGMFDITSGILRKVWTFDGSARVPSPLKVKRLLSKIGWNKVTWDDPAITLPAGMEIDLGGIGKEYAVDRTVQLIKNRFHGAFLVNFGGDVAVWGKRRDGNPWSVGIEDPNRQGNSRMNLPVVSGALATSGDTFRYLKKGGRRYAHILNPLTGFPAKNAPHSVTVLDDTCTNAGILATLAMLQGEEAEAFLSGEGVKYWVIRD